MFRRIRFVDDSSILIRRLELELIMIRQVIIERVGVFPVRRVAYLNGIAVAVNRIHSQVEGIYGFTIVMCRIHHGDSRSRRIQRIHDIDVVSDGVIHTGGGEDTIVEAIGLTFTNMLIIMYVEGIGVAYFPCYDTITFVSAVVMDDRMMFGILPSRDGDDGVGVVTRLFDPCVFVRPEELNGVTLTETVLVHRDVRLVRTHDDVQRIHFTAVIDDGVVGYLHTDPFALPFIHFLAIGVECRIDGVAQVQRHRFFANEDGVCTINIEVRNDGQVYIDDGVTTASGLVLKRCLPSFAINGVEPVTGLAYYVRQFMLADSIITFNVIYGIDLDRYVEYRVTWSVRGERSYRNTVHEGGVSEVYLITPVCTVVLTSANGDRRIISLCNGQVQGVVFLDKAFGIEYRVGIDAGYIKCILFASRRDPYIGIFLIRVYVLCRIVGANGYIFAVLCNDVEDTDAVALRIDRCGITILTAFGDVVVVPIEALTLSEDNRIFLDLLRRDGNHYFQLSLTAVSANAERYGELIHIVGTVNIVSIRTTEDRCRMTDADIVVLSSFLYRIHLQCQGVEVRDITLCVAYCIGINTRSEIVLIILIPGVG